MRRLIEYEKMKHAAQQARRAAAARPRLPPGRSVDRADAAQRLPQVHVRTSSRLARLLARAKMTRHHRVTREELSVREYMTAILRRFPAAGSSSSAALFDPEGVAVVVVSFLAVLELVRESLIEVTQSEPYAPIYV